jgi:hypothetical protein
MSDTDQPRHNSSQTNSFAARIILMLTALLAMASAISILAINVVSSTPSIELLPKGTAPDQADKYLRALDAKMRMGFVQQLQLEVQARPLNEEPIKKLAALAQTGPQSIEGNGLVMLAANRVWRDIALQSSALQLELVQKNYAAAIYRLNIIFHTQPEKKTEVMKVLGGLTTPSSLGALVDALAQGPVWRKEFLLDVSSNPSVDPDTIYNLFSALRKAGSPANQDELRGFLQRLITMGAEDKAYFVWLDSINEESLRKSGMLHDGGFDLLLTNQFFSWTVDMVPNVDARIVPRGPGSVDKVLRVEFASARTAYNSFYQLLNLAPGSYVLAGESKADNLETPVGLVWRINCASQSVDVLGTTKPISGNLQWSTFEASFEVPEEGCRTQSLRLQVNAMAILDTQISGQAQFDNFVISRKKQ